MIEDGETGFICDENDLEAMAGRGVELLTNRELHERISGAAVVVVRQKFCADMIVPQYLQLYEDVVSHKA